MKEKISIDRRNLKKGKSLIEICGEVKSDLIKENMSLAQKKRFEKKEDHPRYGKHHTRDTKNKIKKSHYHLDLNDNKNPAWKGGNSRKYLRKLFKELRLLNECWACPSKKNLHIHHHDDNPQNGKLSNLVVLCSSHHRKAHNGGF